MLPHLSDGSSMSWSANGGERHPECYAKDFARLEEVLALLNAIGWSEAEQPAEVVIDLCEHRWALLKAIETVARVAADELDEIAAVHAERAAKGEMPKRKSTLKRVFAVSDFCWTAVIAIARMDAEEYASR
jgi:hypothetical protein